MAKLIKNLRDFPSVEELLQAKELNACVSMVPRPAVSMIIKDVISSQKIELKKSGKEISYSAFINQIKKELTLLKRKEISKVINATGIIIHTNLGRAPLSEDLFDAIKENVVGYGNVEFDVASGKRGSRGEALEKYLSILSGSEGGTIVNNCAAALFIILNSFANRKKVIISRSELVQIGGGFRIPDILKKSGARLAEIGTTNITSLSDYEKAIDDRTGMILKVHQSNFTQQGFVEQVSIGDLSKLCQKSNVPLVNDLGSGVFVSTKKLLGYPGQTVWQSVKSGSDLTCFSGDKMLGGSQAGLIVGKAEFIKKIKSNPLFRTFRVDKIVFSIMEKVIASYLNDSWQTDIKLWSLLSISEAELYKRGKEILKKLGNPEGVSVEATKAYVGGGSLPDAAIPSVGVIFSKTYKASALLKKLRDLPVPVIGRIEDDRLILDLKAIDESDLSYLLKSINNLIKK